jgi:hypothetical protein
VACNQRAALVQQDEIIEAEFPDARDELIRLSRRMSAGISVAWRDL